VFPKQWNEIKIGDEAVSKYNDIVGNVLAKFELDSSDDENLDEFKTFCDEHDVDNKFFNYIEKRLLKGNIVNKKLIATKNGILELGNVTVKK